MDNLICLRGGHHDAVHVGRSRIERAASGETVFTHAGGRRYGAAPAEVMAHVGHVATHVDDASGATHAGRSLEVALRRAMREASPR